MKLKWLKWTPRVDFGWYRGNPIVGFTFEIFTPIEDYPSGWMFITIIGITFLKFEASFDLKKRGT